MSFVTTFIKDGSTELPRAIPKYVRACAQQQTPTRSATPYAATPNIWCATRVLISSTHLVDELAVADGARQLEVTLEVLHRAREIILLVVENPKRAARLGLRGELARTLRELQVALHVV